MPQTALWRELVDHLRSTTDAEVVHDEHLEQDVRASADILVATGVSQSQLDEMPALRVLGIPFAGINTAPLSGLRERNIAVVNAHANGRWVAERVLALTFAALGRIVAWDRDLRNGRWHGFAAGEPLEESWDSLVGKRVAVLGTGSLGQWTARLMKPFDVTLAGFRRTPGTSNLPPALFDSVTTDLESALAGAEIVVMTLPLTDSTRGLIGADELALMRGAILVHVGRGPVIDESALYRALSDGTLRGAAIDTWWVYPREPERLPDATLPSREPIHLLDNVVLSPHLGGYTRQASDATARELVDVLASVARGERDLTRDPVVDLDAGY